MHTDGMESGLKCPDCGHDTFEIYEDEEGEEAGDESFFARCENCGFEATSREQIEP